MAFYYFYIILLQGLKLTNPFKIIIVGMNIYNYPTYSILTDHRIPTGTLIIWVWNPYTFYTSNIEIVEHFR